MWGAFRLCRGLDIEKLIKPPMIYSVSYFDLWELSTLFVGAKPTKAPPVATGLKLTDCEVELFFNVPKMFASF